MTTLDQLEALVNHALAEGARAAEVLLVRGTGCTLSLKPGARIHTRRAQHEQLTVRVWADGGRAGRMRGPWAEAHELVSQALASTFEHPEDPFAGPVDRLGIPSPGLGTADRRQPALTDADRTDVVVDIERQLKSDRRFGSAGVRYEEEALWRGLVNSRGVRLEEPSTRFRLDASLAGAGLELKEHLEARAFATVAALPLGTLLVRRAHALLADGDTLPAGPVRVVLPSLPMARLLAALGERFDPARLARRELFLLDAPPPTGDLLHVVDDGASPGGLRTRAFDDRGVPPVPLTLIRDGEVGARFLDPEAARALGTRPTGHCWDDKVGASNLLMRAGTRSVNALLTELGGPSLRVDDLPDLGGLDLRTGALDLRVNGAVMRANKQVGAMRGVRLHGNLGELLARVVEVSSDTERVGHVDAAGIIADGLFLEP